MVNPWKYEDITNNSMQLFIPVQSWVATCRLDRWGLELSTADRWSHIIQPGNSRGDPVSARSDQPPKKLVSLEQSVGCPHSNGPGCSKLKLQVRKRPMDLDDLGAANMWASSQGWKGLVVHPGSSICLAGKRRGQNGVRKCEDPLNDWTWVPADSVGGSQSRLRRLVVIQVEPETEI